jgi:NADPH:quinone reductase-like Zn-dependent oxidoreductase
MSQTAAVVAENAGPGKWTTSSQIAIPEPPAGKLIVKTVAFAANPTDWKHIAFQQGQPGDIAGSDAAGFVHAVGEGVTGFSVGDVVSTFSHGNFSKERGSFAEYIIADVETTIKYDGSFQEKTALPQGEYRSGTIDTWEGAASVTLGLTTVILSLAGNLNVKSEDAGKYILIWGGATATGILAIQIAKLGLGLKVITTASKKNHEFLKSLGADLVFDYNDANVTQQIRDAANGDIRYALDTVSSDQTWQSVYDATKGSIVTLDSLLFKSLADLKLDDRDSSSVTVASPTLAYLANGEETDLFGSHFIPDQVTLKRYNKFWQEKLPTVIPQLKHAKLKVLAPGLKSTNDAFDLLKEDKVSGEKVVFSLK